MTVHATLYDRTTTALDRLGKSLVPLMARACFAAVLLMYFWVSGLPNWTELSPPHWGPMPRSFHGRWRLQAMTSAKWVRCAG
jgi:hypothetical protein